MARRATETRVHVTNDLMAMVATATWLSEQLTALEIRRQVALAGCEPRSRARQPTKDRKPTEGEVQIDRIEQIVGIFEEAVRAAESSAQDPLGQLREKSIPSFAPQGNGTRMTQSLWAFYRGRSFAYVVLELLPELTNLLQTDGIREQEITKTYRQRIERLLETLKG